MSNLIAISQRINAPMENELHEELCPPNAIIELLKNLIASVGDLDYTPQSELGKSFRLLKSGQSLPDRAWQSI